MNLMRASEYGIHGVLYLALQEEGKIIILEEIAEAQKIPKNYLSKIFQRYTKTGILKSFRGANKGFMLAKSPEKISLLDLIESYEGKFVTAKCLLGIKNCSKNKTCKIAVKCGEARAAMKKIFKKTTIRDLFENSKNCPETT